MTRSLPVAIVATLGLAIAAGEVASALTVLWAPTDFDQDQRSELVVYNPSTGMWTIRQSKSGYSAGGGLSFQWGLPGDLPAPGDFDGDGKPDIAVYRPTTGVWFVRYSSRNYLDFAYGSYQWGLAGDQHVLGDFDGDAQTDLTVYRPTNGVWFMKLSLEGYDVNRYRWLQWGLPGDQPLAGDFDGDGQSEIIVYRPTTGDWYFLVSSQDYNINFHVKLQWGLPGDLPLIGDFDGDGSAEMTVYRPTTGEWFIRYSSQSYVIGAGNWLIQWGLPGDKPIVGDFDGDGKSEISVFRPSTGQWFVLYSTQGHTRNGYGLFQVGAGELPVEAPRNPLTMENVGCQFLDGIGTASSPFFLGPISGFNFTVSGCSGWAFGQSDSRHFRFSTSQVPSPRQVIVLKYFDSAGDFAEVVPAISHFVTGEIVFESFGSNNIYRNGAQHLRVIHLNPTQTGWALVPGDYRLRTNKAALGGSAPPYTIVVKMK